MSDLGRYMIGEFVPLILQCRTPAGTPDVPADNPVASFYKPDGTLFDRQRLPADLQGVTPGLFRLGYQIPNLGVLVGPHTVAYSWVDSGGHAMADADVFSLLPGGQADGSVVALRSIRRPQAVYLLRQQASGLMRVGKNPR